MTPSAESPGADSIFVAIAAYREPELRLTIQSCIHNAARPGRLTFGVCLQHDDAGLAEVHSDCLDGLDATVRLLSFDWTESKGGCWARHLTQGLYEGEAYTLQIDAHSRMEPDWDVDLIEMVRTFPGAKPLITGFPPLYFRDSDEQGQEYDILPEGSREYVPVTFASDWSESGALWHPTEVRETEVVHPRPTRFLSGAFAFTLGQWNLEVRQDPEHLYAGEELALAIRSFTSGYDLYNPSKVVAWHRGHPTTNPKYIHEGPSAEVERRAARSLKRLRTLFRGDRDQILAPYSIGTERSVRQYAAWSGLNCETFEASEAAQQGLAPPLSASSSV